MVLTEEMLSKASLVKSDLEAEITRSRREVADLQDALQRMKLASDDLNQDRTHLNKTIMQVRH